MISVIKNLLLYFTIICVIATFFTFIYFEPLFWLNPAVSYGTLIIIALEALMSIVSFASYLILYRMERNSQGPRIHKH